MFKLLRLIVKNESLNRPSKQLRLLLQCRTFLSQAYYCNEVWEQRFRDPLLQKVGLDELYSELDQRYNKTRTMSAVDVDVFVNAVKDDTYVDELLDLTHKLRMSGDTCNMLGSTPHAVVRSLFAAGKLEQLLSVLDDRLNYGIFLDFYTANLLLDTFWKKKDYVSGARTASQLMLQEDINHPLSASLSLLHCYCYLTNQTEWPQPPKPEEPEEEIKIRINYLRNPFDDRHFDLKDPLQIVGKTIIMITKPLTNNLDKSLHLLGLALFEQYDEARKLIENLKKDNESIHASVLKLIPEGNPLQEETKNLQTQEADMQQMLEECVRLAEQNVAEKDIAQQCETYLQWEEERHAALKRQQERVLRAKRLAHIEELQKNLKEREALLWYFENEEKIELQIEDKKEQLEKIQQNRPKSVVQAEENYVPPEVQKKYV